MIDALADNAQLGAISEQLQPPVQTFFAREKPLFGFLRGTWLGHPLHPMLTDIPIGAWSLATAFDGLAFGRPEFASAADASIAIGIAGAVGAAITGIAEWSDTKDKPQRLGTAHALLNSTALSVYVASLALRASDKRPLGVAASLAGLGIASLSAYIGGDLTYRYGMGVQQDGAGDAAPAPL